MEIKWIFTILLLGVFFNGSVLLLAIRVWDRLFKRKGKWYE